MQEKYETYISKFELIFAPYLGHNKGILLKPMAVVRKIWQRQNALCLLKCHDLWVHKDTPLTMFHGYIMR